VYSLSEGNIPTTDFEHKILLWQMLSITIPTVHSTAYSLHQNPKVAVPKSPVRMIVMRSISVPVFY